MREKDREIRSSMIDRKRETGRERSSEVEKERESQKVHWCRQREAVRLCKARDWERKTKKYAVW